MAQNAQAQVSLRGAGLEALRGSSQGEAFCPFPRQALGSSDAALKSLSCRDQERGLGRVALGSKAGMGLNSPQVCCP